MRNYPITDTALDKIKQGHKLLDSQDFVVKEAVLNKTDGTIIHLIDRQKNFVAKAVLSQQNKGIGWIFTDNEKIYYDQDFFENMIEDAIDLRQDFFNVPQTTAFRLINGEGDNLAGMTIDWYDHYLQINWYTRAIYQNKEWILTVLNHFLPQIKGIYETKRFVLEEGEEAINHIQGQEAPQPLMIKENNINYAVYLGQDWMTGIFLDQREVRQFIESQAADQEVLNLFSYTGAFSVAAAVGGAKKTISVDVANRSLEKTKEQFLANQETLDLEKDQIRVMDVFDYVQYALRNDLTFDWIVCDPPSFARTKKYQFSVEKDYIHLIEDLFNLTKPGGFCVISTNHSGYYKESFMNDIQALIGKRGGDFHLIQSFGLPKDFPTSKDPESQYLKVAVFYRLS